MRPKIKDGVSVIFKPLRGESGYELSFLMNATGSVYSFNINEQGLRAVKMFNGKHTITSISKDAGVTAEGITALTGILADKGLLEIQNSCYTANTVVANTPQLNFFSGFEKEPGEGLQFQSRLETAKVGIIGIGGIGSWVLKGLLHLGVKKFVIADPDRVEASNLNRQCLYRENDVGSKKLTSLKNNLDLQACDLKIEGVSKKILTTSQCDRIFKDIDLLINCADEPSTDKINRIVTASCYPRRIPHILCGGYDGHLGFVGPTIIPDTSPCWYCCEASINDLVRKSNYKHMLVTDSDKVGSSIAPICAIIANFHVMEAMKVLTGIVKPTMIDQMLEIDFLTYGQFPKKLVKRASCNLCNKKGAK